VLRWMIERMLKRTPAPAKGALRRTTLRLPDVAGLGGDIAATWLGHSTVLLQVGGINILTDPVWARRVSPVTFAGPKRWVPPTLPIAELPPIHVVLQSHDHYDHFDLAATRAIAARNPDALWCVPLGMRDSVSRCGVHRITEQDWWTSTTHTVTPAGSLANGNAPVVRVQAVPAQHFSGRGLTDRDRTLWCGWVIEVDGRRIYFAGDSALHPEFGDIARRTGPFDLTIIPIGAYDPRWFMRAVHMDPDEAVVAWQTIAEVQRDVHHRAPPPMLCIHWGTYKLTDEPMDEPPKRAAAAWAAAGLNPDLLWICAHGESRQTAVAATLHPAARAEAQGAIGPTSSSP
jgi:N-acyl-phosphatidylethanolamine-hydrolysing phospholipase D